MNIRSCKAIILIALAISIAIQACTPSPSAPDKNSKSDKNISSKVERLLAKMSLDQEKHEAFTPKKYIQSYGQQKTRSRIRLRHPKLGLQYRAL